MNINHKNISCRLITDNSSAYISLHPTHCLFTQHAHANDFIINTNDPVLNTLAANRPLFIVVHY